MESLSAELKGFSAFGAVGISMCLHNVLKL